MNNTDGEWVTGNVTLRINGEPLDMQMTVPAYPVRPERMLPIFQQMANSFVDASVSAAESEGKPISCRAGCGACCRQPVPISETEVYQIAELVESMPEPKRSAVKERFRLAAGHFQKTGWFERMNRIGKQSKVTDQQTAAREVSETAMEYFRDGIPCPFLENESCSIHQNRPVSCREYMVTSPAENCSSPTAATIQKLDLLIKPSHTLMALSKSGRMENEGLITLIRALELAEKYPNEYPERTGEEWMAAFFKLLTHSDPTAPKS